MERPTYGQFRREDQTIDWDAYTAAGRAYFAGPYKQRVFELLRQAGVAQMVVSFSGGGDEGNIDEISLVGSDGEVLQTCGYYTTFEHPHGPLLERLADEFVDEFVDFNNEDKRGTVVYDVEAEMIVFNLEISAFIEQEAVVL